MRALERVGGLALSESEWEETKRGEEERRGGEGGGEEGGGEGGVTEITRTPYLGYGE